VSVNERGSEAVSVNEREGDTRALEKTPMRKESSK